MQQNWIPTRSGCNRVASACVFGSLVPFWSRTRDDGSALFPVLFVVASGAGIFRSSCLPIAHARSPFLPITVCHSKQSNTHSQTSTSTHTQEDHENDQEQRK
jgi:hypothetical protein